VKLKEGGGSKDTEEEESKEGAYDSSLQIKLLSSQRRAFLDLRDASPIAMEQLQRILGSPAI
jgi:hypothetical protein